MGKFQGTLVVRLTCGKTVKGLSGGREGRGGFFSIPF